MIQMKYENIPDDLKQFFVPRSAAVKQRSVLTIPTTQFTQAHFAVFPHQLIISPIRSSCPKGGVLLDPFLGSGTTAIMARALGRDWVGIELSEKYVEMAYGRLSEK